MLMSSCSFQTVLVINCSRDELSTCFLEILLICRAGKILTLQTGTLYLKCNQDQIVVIVQK